MSTEADERQILIEGHDFVSTMDPTGCTMKPTDPSSGNFLNYKIKFVELRRKPIMLKYDSRSNSKYYSIVIYGVFFPLIH